MLTVHHSRTHKQQVTARVSIGGLSRGVWLTGAHSHLGRCRRLLCGLLLLLERLVDAGHDATAGEGDVLQEGAEVVVVADSKGQCARGKAVAVLLLLLGGLDRQLNQLSAQVFKDRCHVHSTGTAHTLGIASTAEHGPNAANGEVEAGLCALALALRCCGFAFPL